MTKLVLKETNYEQNAEISIFKRGVHALPAAVHFAQEIEYNLYKRYAIISLLYLNNN